MIESMEGFAPAARELVAEGIACRRGGRLVFADLDCRLPPGGALLLTGRNGSGKSSLLRLLAGLLAPAAGQVLWGGEAVDANSAGYRGALHYVGHLDSIKPALNPRETLHYWTVLRAAGAAGVERALAVFGLDAVADFPCRWLSAGQRRRLALARLAAIPAALWLLDEPTAALDRDGEAVLLQLVAGHRARGGSIVSATHQPLPLAGAEELSLEDFAAIGDAAAVPW